MLRRKAAPLALGISLALAPLASAHADWSHHGGGWGHGYYGGHGYVWPAAVAGAVVGTAAAIITAPFALLNAAVNAPYYAPPPSYPAYNPPTYYAPPSGYNAPSGYYNVPPDYTYPTGGAYYAPQAPAYASRPTTGYYAAQSGTYGGAPGYYGQPYSTPRAPTEYAASDYYGSQPYTQNYPYDYGR